MSGVQLIVLYVSQKEIGGEQKFYFYIHAFCLLIQSFVCLSFTFFGASPPKHSLARPQQTPLVVAEHL